MFKRSFDIMKNLIGQVSGLSSDDISQFQKCKNVKEAHALIRRDFFVVTPYYSVKYHHSKIYEGTRLTLQVSPSSIPLLFPIFFYNYYFIIYISYYYY